MNIKAKLYKIYKRQKLRVFRNRLAKGKSVTIHPSCSGYLQVNFDGYNGIPENCHFLGNSISIGEYTTLGRNNLLSGKVKIGKYCQIGADVAIHASDHPITFMTTYINRSLFNGELRNLKIQHEIVIGNDVWIGHGVIIVGNVTIGNGAILAAGSVITKDVSPYAIVGGVPAKELKKRFSNSIISELEELKWWDLSDSELEQNKPLFFKDLSKINSIYE